MKQVLAAVLLLCAAVMAYGAKAPDFTVTTSDGQQRKLYADYVNQQKVLVIEAFFTTCPPCNTHAPYWQSLYQSMLAAHPGKVEFMMLSTQNFDKNANVATYKTNKGLTMPGVGQDGGSVTALAPYAANQFGLFQGTPTFIIITPGSGEVVFDIRGNTPQETMAQLTARIDDLLAVRCDIRDFFNTPIEGVSLRVDGASFDTTLLVNGTYSLSKVNALRSSNYRLKPEKTDNPLTGVSTLDLALITKHILGIEPFHCPWQLLAADINCSGTITTFDVVTARKLILGILDTLPCGSWRFAGPSDTTSRGNCVAFQGAKIGDVNAGPNCPSNGFRTAEARSAAPCQFYVGDRLLQKGHTYNIPLRVSAATAVSAFQLNVDLNPAAVRLEGITAAAGLNGFSAEMYRQDPSSPSGRTTVLWYGAQAATVTAAEPLLWWRLTALEDVSLRDIFDISGAGPATEWYDDAGVAHPLQLQWETPAAGTAALRIAPNPNHGAFTLHWEAPEAASTLVQVFDVQGKTVFEQAFAVLQGDNQIALQLPENRPGLYWVKAGGLSVGKMLLLTDH